MLWLMSGFFDHPILDTKSGHALYRQVYVWIRDGIDRGALAVGDRIPATRELSGLIGLNRTTISAAYELYKRGELELASLVRVQNDVMVSYRRKDGAA